MHPLHPRFALRLVVLALALLGPLAVAAQSGKATDAPPQNAPKATAGVITGLVTSVDYQRGRLGVWTSGHRVDVTVLPSTSIQGKGSAYHSIAEINRGTQVEIFTSVREGKVTAQIIRLR